MFFFIILLGFAEVMDLITADQVTKKTESGSWVNMGSSSITFFYWKLWYPQKVHEECAAWSGRPCKNVWISWVLRKSRSFKNLKKWVREGDVSEF